MSNTTGVPVNHRTLVRRTVSLHQSGYSQAHDAIVMLLRAASRTAGVALATVDDMGFAHVCSQNAVSDGGAYRDRTDDLMLAKQPLSQLS